MQAERTLAAVLAALDVVVFETDREGHILSSGGAALRGIGVETNENVGKPLSAYFTEAEWAAEPFRRALAGEASAGSGPFRGRYFSVQLMPARDEQGVITGVLGVARDESEREAARAYASRSLNLESRVVAEAAVGIIVLDAQLRYRMWNPYVARLLGVSAESVVGRHPWEVFPGLSPQRLRADLKRALGGAITSSAGEMTNRTTGERVVIATTMAPMQDADGTVMGVVQLVRDVTEQRRLQEAVESSERSFRQLIDDAPDGMLVQRAGRIVYVNRSLLALLGYADASELVGRPMLALVRVDQHERAVRRLLEIQRGTAPSSQEYFFVARSGREVPVELRCTAISFEGQPALLAVCRDQTVRVALQAQLMASDRLSSMGALAAGVAHEINNPLAAMLANLEAGLRDLAQVAAVPGVAEALEPLRDARDAAVRLKDIARDLKLFSRSEDDVATAVDLTQLMDSTLRLALNEIRHRAVLHKDYAPVPQVLANEARLGQVFLSLIINATQAIPEGRATEHEIRVVLRTDEQGRAVVEIRDTGAGMPPEVLTRIFDPFFTTKPATVGTGLGLAICQRLVSAVGGTIVAESEPGKGSVFRVTLPAVKGAEPPVHVPEPAVPAAGATPRGVVLVVDDDATVAKSIARALKRRHDVTIETDAAAALARLRDGQRFDVILCDIMMPSMTGMDFHAELTRFAPAVAAQVVFMTGGVFSHAAREFLDQVPNTMVEKPFDASTLNGLIDGRLRR